MSTVQRIAKNAAVLYAARIVTSLLSLVLFIYIARILGDVILSTETTQRQACEHKNSFDRELYSLLIHGILHLLGHNHDTDEETRVMQTLEQTLLKKLER